MEKTFTVNVPDDLWVDAWTENKTTSYTYNGPETLNVVVSLEGDFDVITWSDGEIDRTIDEEKEQLVTIDANTDTGVAYHFWHAADEWEYTYDTITNHDDSTHEEINNPRLRDIYDPKWTPADGWSLDPIYKATETLGEVLAQERLAYVVKYDDAYDFDADTQAIIDTFKTNVQTYLDSMATVYPWRYETLDQSAVPKVPATLVTVFNDLPHIG